jgi:hypothetical protein
VAIASVAVGNWDEKKKERRGWGTEYEYEERNTAGVTRFDGEICPCLARPHQTEIEMRNDDAKQGRGTRQDKTVIYITNTHCITSLFPLYTIILYYPACILTSCQILGLPSY